MASTSKKMQRTEGRSLTGLPFEVICVIMSKVGKKSFKQLLRTKTCCKLMGKAGEWHLVYMELDIFNVLKLPITLDIVDVTMKKCEANGNLLHLFRDGVFAITGSGDNTKLRLAADQGQRHAIFMNAMLMIVADWKNREQALRVLNATFRGSGRGDEIREILFVIGGLWRGRKLKHNGIWWTCPEHADCNHWLAGYNRRKRFEDCGVCFWEYCFDQFVSIFVVD